MRELLLKLKAEGKTILLASHAAEDIEVLCDKVYEMEMGCVHRVRGRSLWLAQLKTLVVLSVKQFEIYIGMRKWHCSFEWAVVSFFV